MEIISQSISTAIIIHAAFTFLKISDKLMLLRLETRALQNRLWSKIESKCALFDSL